MRPADTTELREVAVDVARRAGRLLVEQRPEEGPAVVQTKTSPTDIVTAMDTAAERLIVAALRAARPGDGVLAEEGGGAEGTTGVRWVVDPLDGSVNYLYGLPEWAVSVAAEIEGRTAVGVVAVPPRGELFSAVRGGGAWLGDVRLRSNRDVPLHLALVATGFGYASDRRARQAEVVRSVLPRVRDIRRGGSCAIDLCSVACGRVDAYYERGMKPWDLAAGVLIAQESGAMVEGLRSRPASGDLTIAAAPETFRPLHDLLAPLNP
ncbi:MAG: inositol monophosphatase family protein [Streptosporangiaceae bacterium]